MNKIFHALTSLTMLTAQVVSTVPHPTTAQATALAQPASTKIAFRLGQADPFTSKSKPVNFDTDVLVPLRATQAAEARAEAAARAKAIATARAATRIVVVAGSDVWAQLRFCESGGNYATNTGNGFYGAYQYDLRTWNNYGGYARPDLAPAAMQDEKARLTQAARGWAPWPACSRKLGLR